MVVEGTRVLSGPALLADFYVGPASRGSHATIITLHVLGFCRNRICEHEASSDDRSEVRLIRDDVCR